ncbi:sensor histidine kinase [Bordetella genomosp. 1]|uniref:histidine kinase n=1 Tax=Bordetella genomosp. 1 TaxID=1395607 RepID=A0ABX4F0S5_9BORD|nr:ATP-binding protein [Bordetella genomosp. 1]OZI65612.1 hypothetical protein CAL27_11335 [Bordetella genomosp. 1]
MSRNASAALLLYRLLLLLSLCCLWQPRIATAQVADETTVELFLLGSAPTSFAEAQAAWRAGEGKPVANDYAAGFGPPLWFAARLSYPPDDDAHILWLRVGPYHLNRIDVFDPGGVTGVQTAGSMVRRSEGVRGERLPVFAVAYPADTASTVVFLRVETRTTRNVFIDAGSEFELSGDRPINGQAAFFWGGLVVTLLWVLLYALWLRFQFYFLYSAYLICIAVGTMTLVGMLSDWLPVGSFNYVLSSTLTLWFLLTVETLGLAAPQRYYSVAFNRYRYASLAVGVLGLSLAAFGRYDLVSPLIQSAFPPFLLTGALLMLAPQLRDQLPARLCAIAFSIEFVLTIAQRFWNLGALPEFPFLRDSYLYNTYVHMMVMNVAVIARMHGLQRERQDAQRLLIDHLQIAERKLETRVTQRTAELRSEIEQREAAEQNLRQANLNVINALAAERRATGALHDLFLMVTHDFRTPLAVLHHHLDGRADTPPAARQAIDDLEHLVDHTLRSVPGDSAVGSAPLCRVDLVDVATRAVARVREGAHRHRFEVYHAAPQMWVRGNRDMLDMMACNLLHNAIVHTPPDTNITVLVRAEGNQSALVVQDDGPGVPEDQLDAIFEKRVRCANTKATGSGLGLYLVARVAEFLAGRVRAEIVRPHGLRLVITLPTADPKPAVAVAPVPAT